MIVCDICGQTKKCSARRIEGKEYDICAACWNPLAAKLKGKGRQVQERETVFLPPLTVKEPEKPEKPAPGEPPKIWSSVRH